MTSATATSVPLEPPPAGARASGTVLDYDAYRAQRHFAALDGVRAVAVLLVFTIHVQYQSFWSALSGGNGVTVFFVLSGFLITTLALREEARRGSLDLGGFYLRRLFRIYPMYLGVLGIYVLLIYGAGFVPERRDLFTEQLPYYALGFPEHGYFSISGGIESGPPYAAAWSIGIEEKFYLVWPVLGFLALRGAFRARLVACAVAGAIFVSAPLVWDDGVYLREYVFITFGVVLALLMHERRWYDSLAVLAQPPVLIGTFVALAAMQLAGVLGYQPFRILDGVLVAVALVGVVTTARRETAWLRARPAIFIGQVSYVFYLTHNFALNAVERSPIDESTLLGSFVVVLVALPLAVLVAWVLHVLVEQPFIRLGRRLAHRDKPVRTV